MNLDLQGPFARVEKREDQLEVFLKYAGLFGVPEVTLCLGYSIFFLIICARLRPLFLISIQEFLFDPEHDLFQYGDIPRSKDARIIVMAIIKNEVSFQNISTFCIWFLSSIVQGDTLPGKDGSIGS